MSDSNVRQPVQARSRQALDRIYAATSALLNETSFDQISVSEIASAAGVAVGSVYQRFKTKDDLLWALYEEYLAVAEETFAGAIAAGEGASLDVRVTRLIDAVSTLFISRRGVVRSLLLKYRQNTEDIPAVFIERINEIYASGIRYIAAAPSLSASDAQIKFAFSLIVSMCREEYLFGDTRRLMRQKKISPEFRRMLRDAVIGVLQPKGAADA